MQGNSGLDLGLLFSSELTLASAPLNISESKWRFLQNTTLIKQSSKDQIRIVTMSSYSQMFHEFILDDDAKVKTLDSLLNGGQIQIEI